MLFTHLQVALLLGTVARGLYSGLASALVWTGSRDAFRELELTVRHFTRVLLCPANGGALKHSRNLNINIQTLTTQQQQD